jgi:CRP-like cAMP-binding protein/tetratricopeptide (TPR) repeat protein
MSVDTFSEEEDDEFPPGRMLSNAMHDEHIVANELRQELFHGIKSSSNSVADETASYVSGDIDDDGATEAGDAICYDSTAFANRELLADSFVVLYDKGKSSRRASASVLSKIVQRLAVCADFAHVIDLVEAHNDGQIGRQPIDCIIMDLGPQVQKMLDYLKSRASIDQVRKLPIVPVVAVTSPPLPELDSLPLGVDAVLARPLQRSDIICCVGGMMRRYTGVEFVYKDIIGEVERFRYPQFDLTGFESGQEGETQMRDAEPIEGVKYIQEQHSQHDISSVAGGGSVGKCTLSNLWGARAACSQRDHENRGREDTSISIATSNAAHVSLSDPCWRPHLRDSTFMKNFILRPLDRERRSKLQPPKSSTAGHSQTPPQDLLQNEMMDLPPPGHNASYFTRKGWKLCRAGDLDGALCALDKSIAVDPSQMEALASRGYVRALCSHLEDALADMNCAMNVMKYRGSTHLDELVVPLLYNTSILHARLGREDAGLDFLNRALKLNAGCLPALLNRALIHRRRGDFAAAQEDLGHVRRLIAAKTPCPTPAPSVDRNPGSSTSSSNRHAAAMLAATTSTATTSSSSTFDRLFCRASDLQVALTTFPEDRSKSHCELIEQLLNDATPMHVLPGDAIRFLAQHAEYRAIEKSKFAARQSEFADSVMLVVSGRLDVKLKRINSSTIVVESLTQGSVLGDDAILSQRRGGAWGEHIYSYQAMAPTELLLIRRADFLDCAPLKEWAHRRLMRKLDTLHSCGLFSEWEWEDVIRLARMSHERRYPTDHVLEKQNDAPSHLQLLVRGICEVTRSPDTLAQVAQKVTQSENELQRIKNKYSFHHALRPRTADHRPLSRSATEKRQVELEAQVKAWKVKLERLRRRTEPQQSAAKHQQAVMHVTELRPPALFGESGVLYPGKSPDGGGRATVTVVSLTTAETLAIHVSALQTFKVTSQLLTALQRKVTHYSDSKCEALIEGRKAWQKVKASIVEEAIQSSGRDRSRRHQIAFVH